MPLKLALLGCRPSGSSEIIHLFLVAMQEVRKLANWLMPLGTAEELRLGTDDLKANRFGAEVRSVQ